jgi:CHAT domain-containing protein
MKQIMKNRWLGYVALFLITLGWLLGKPMISRAIATPSASTAADSKAAPAEPAVCQTAKAQQNKDCLLEQVQADLAVNNDNQAKDTLERLISPDFSEQLSHDDKVRIWQTLGDIYAKRGDLARARQTLEQILEPRLDTVTTPAAQSGALYSLALIASTELETYTIVGTQPATPAPTSDRIVASYETFHTQLRQTLQQFDASVLPLQANDTVEALESKLAQMRLLVTQLPRFYQFFASDRYQITLRENSGVFPTELQELTELQDQIEILKNRIDNLETFQRQFQPIRQAIVQSTQTLVQEVPAIQLAFQNVPAQTKVLDKSRAAVAEKSGESSPDRRWLAARIYYAQTLVLLSELGSQGYDANLEYRNLVTVLASQKAALKQKQAQVAAQSQGQSAPIAAATPRPAVPRTPPKPVSLLPADLQAQIDAIVRRSHQDAAQHLATVIQQARRSSLPTLEFQATGSLVKLYAQANQPDQISQLLTPAMLQNVDRVGAPELAAPLYGYYARALRSQGEPFRAQALVASDVAIARIQAVRGDLLALAPGVQYSYRNDVESFYRENIELRLLNNPTPKELEIVRDRIEDLQLAEIQNYFREPCIQGKSTKLDTTLDKDSPNTAVIYPIVSPEQLTVIVRLPNQPLQAYKTSVSDDEVTAAVQTWQKQLRESNGESAKIAGRQLYDWLIAPYASSLDTVDTLVFVLDGELRNAPMAALVNEQNRYLIESKAVVVSPGLQLFDPRPIANRNLNVFMAGLKGKPPAPYSQLQFVEQEFAAIAQTGIKHQELTGKFESKALQGRIQANPFSIVHLSTHGTFSDKLENTYLVSEGGADPDGKILITRLQEVLQSRDRTREEPIELLVLSACETAVSARAALGIAGLTLKTGVRSTVATLWAVYDDPGIPKFFTAFYTALQKPNATRAKALQSAQQALLLDPDPTYADPVHWAPFILLGSWM